MATLIRYNRTPLFFNPFANRPVIARYAKTTANVPAVNVKENEAAYQLELAAPGLAKDVLTVKVEGNVLTIAYKPEVQADGTIDKYTRHEFGVNAFERGFRLPKTVNADQITAAYTNGILTVELPKVEVKEEKVIKEIAIA